MIAARHNTSCPGCEAPIEPGDPIDRIGLAFHCEACVREWRRENDAGTYQVRPPAYPISATYEPEH